MWLYQNILDVDNEKYKDYYSIICVINNSCSRYTYVILSKIKWLNYDIYSNLCLFTPSEIIHTTFLPSSFYFVYFVGNFICMSTLHLLKLTSCFLSIICSNPIHLLLVELDDDLTYFINFGLFNLSN